MIYEINGSEELEALMDKGIVVVDFYANWCSPCKKIAPEYERISNIYTGITFVKVDADNFEDLCVLHHVTAMPTFIIFKAGIEETRILGGSRCVIEKMQTVLDGLQ